MIITTRKTEILGKGLVKKLNILGITLARGGSKSIPEKNIADLNGLPLIYYTINEAKKSSLISDYIVSTDSKKIAKVARKFGAEIPFIRPKNISTDTASSLSGLQHAVNFMERKKNITYDYVIELMCTNPLKTLEDIDKCIKKIVRSKSDSVIAMHQLEDHHPARIKKIVKDKIIDFCVDEKNESRRQDLKPKAYIRSGSIYCMKRDYLMKQNRRYGGSDSRPYILPKERTINIDTPYDLEIARLMILDLNKLLK